MANVYVYDAVAMAIYLIAECQWQIIIMFFVWQNKKSIRWSFPVARYSLNARTCIEIYAVATGNIRLRELVRLELQFKT